MFLDEKGKNITQIKDENWVCNVMLSNDVITLCVTLVD